MIVAIQNAFLFKNERVQPCAELEDNALGEAVDFEVTEKRKKGRPKRTWKKKAEEN